MSTRNSILPVHPALGGLDITTDPTVLDPNFLTEATNIEYLEDGRRKKRAGMIQYAPTSSWSGTSSNSMVSSNNITTVNAFADIWTYGNTLTPVQRLVAQTGASIFRSTGNGLWTALSASSSFGASFNVTTNITLAQDYAVISNGSNPPIAYNPSSTTLVAATTGSAWPVFEHSVYHLNRLWIGGVSTAPHEVQYMADGNIFDSTGIDAGRFVFDSGDGDRVIGISKSYFENLMVFKGPQFGSIHRIEGKTPTTFARSKIATGAPVLNHRGIVTTPTDIYWISKYGIHSLQTTLRYGDFEQGFLSLPIQKLWRDGYLNINSLNVSAGFWNPTRNIIGWIVPITTLFPFGPATEGVTAVIVYNYAISDPAPGGKKYWSVWTLPFQMWSVGTLLQTSAPVANETNHSHLYFGGAGRGGNIYFAEYNRYEDELEAIVMKIRTPTIMRYPSGNNVTVPETQEKQFAGVTTFLGSNTGGTAQMIMNIDGRPQTKVIDLGIANALLT